MTKDWRNALESNTMSDGKILFARHEDVYVLKFVGGIHYGQNWSFDLSKALASFLDRIFADQDFSDIIVDLREATSIDSTNLGLLARIAIFVQEKYHRKPTLISTDENVNNTLRTVGFRQIFNITDKPLGTPEADIDLPQQGKHEVNLPRVLLVAHRTLCALNEDNESRFRDLVDTLEQQVAEDLKGK